VFENGKLQAECDQLIKVVDELANMLHKTSTLCQRTLTKEYYGNVVKEHYEAITQSATAMKAYSLLPHVQAKTPNEKS